MDHVGIYMLIAGTYTPIAWTFLRRHWRRGVLGLVWLWAALGITIRLTYETQPPWLSTAFYLGMGWGALFCYFEVARRLSHRAMIPIVAGGVLYSLGAIFNLLHGPVLWPGVFQAHELFHLFVVAGSMCHFYFMLTVVGPSELDAQLLSLPSDSPPLRSTFTAQPAPGQVGG
jgi:hemolysin III